MQVVHLALLQAVWWMEHISLMQLLLILHPIRVFFHLRSPLLSIQQKGIQPSLHDQLLELLYPVKIQYLPLLEPMLHTLHQPLTNVVLMLEHGHHVFQPDLPHLDLRMQLIPFHSVVLIRLETQKLLQTVLPLR